MFWHAPWPPCTKTFQTMSQLTLHFVLSSRGQKPRVFLCSPNVTDRSLTWKSLLSGMINSYNWKSKQYSTHSDTALKGEVIITWATESQASTTHTLTWHWKERSSSHEWLKVKPGFEIHTLWHSTEKRGHHHMSDWKSSQDSTQSDTALKGKVIITWVTESQARTPHTLTRHWKERSSSHEWLKVKPGLHTLWHSTERRGHHHMSDWKSSQHYTHSDTALKGKVIITWVTESQARTPHTLTQHWKERSSSHEWLKVKPGLHTLWHSTERRGHHHMSDWKSSQHYTHSDTALKGEVIITWATESQARTPHTLTRHWKERSSSHEWLKVKPGLHTLWHSTERRGHHHMSDWKSSQHYTHSDTALKGKVIITWVTESQARTPHTLTRHWKERSSSHEWLKVRPALHTLWHGTERRGHHHMSDWKSGQHYTHPDTALKRKVIITWVTESQARTPHTLTQHWKERSSSHEWLKVKPALHTLWHGTERKGHHHMSDWKSSQDSRSTHSDTALKGEVIITWATESQARTPHTLTRHWKERSSSHEWLKVKPGLNTLWHGTEKKGHHHMSDWKSNQYYTSSHRAPKGKVDALAEHDFHSHRKTVHL